MFLKLFLFLQNDKSVDSMDDFQVCSKKRKPKVLTKKASKKNNSLDKRTSKKSGVSPQYDSDSFDKLFDSYV